MAEDNVTHFPVIPRPRLVGAVVQNVLAAVRPNSSATASMHDHAEAYHCAMARALRLSEDIEDIKRDLRQHNFRSEHAGHESDLRDLEKRYADSLGEAAVALEKMPAKWAAMFVADVPPPTPEVA